MEKNTNLHEASYGRRILSMEPKCNGRLNLVLTEAPGMSHISAYLDGWRKKDTGELRFKFLRASRQRVLAMNNYS